MIISALKKREVVLRSALLYLLGSHNYSGGYMATTSERGSVSVRSMLPVLGASTIGTAIEWYDFFLYGFLIFMAVVSFISTALPREDLGRAAAQDVAEPAAASVGA